MADKKTTSKQDVRSDRGAEIVDQLENVFLAGLGALSNAQKVGGKAFETLVEQGESFRKQTTDRTEGLIENVQGAIREMTGEAQSRATGLLSHMRETPQMNKLQSVFDDRVAEALDRLGVATKQSLDELNARLEQVLAALEEQNAAPTAKATRKKASRKAGRKTAAKKKVTTKKAAAVIKPSRKKQA